MGKLYNNAITTTAGFKYESSSPLDDRLVVQYSSDLTSLTKYTGMLVYVVADKTYYKYENSSWLPIVDSALSDTSTNAIQNKVVKAALDGKSNTSHTHNYAGSSTAGGAANSVKAALTFSTSGNGAGNSTTYNGSTARTISYNSVGAAPASHTHTKSEITDFAHNHDDRYYTETEVDDKISSAISSVLRYKGTKSTTAGLPTSGNTVGDVWNITTACAASGTLPKVNAGDNVAWNGTSWDVLAGTVDLSNYYIKSEVNNELAKKAHVDHTHRTTYTPDGSVSQPIFTGTPEEHSHTFSVDASHAHSFAGDGTVIEGTFTGQQQTVSASYTPAGSVSAPTITVTPTTTEIYSITNVGKAPELAHTTITSSKINSWEQGGGSASLTASAGTSPNRTVTLTFAHTHTAPVLGYTKEVESSKITKWSAGDVPTRSSAINAYTGLAASASAPIFTGAEADITHSFTPGGTISITTTKPTTTKPANYTPGGAIGQQTISINGTTEKTPLTPAGTVSKPTFTGTLATINIPKSSS